MKSNNDQSGCELGDIMIVTAHLHLIAPPF